MKAKAKRQDTFDEFFPAHPLPVHIFRAGDVLDIVGIEKWRLEKFLTGKQYRLSPSGYIGKGAGSWRLFSLEDVYRIAIANRLVRDGFTAKFVSLVLENISPAELLERDHMGESAVPDVGVFRAQRDEPDVRFISSSRTAQEKQQPYYVLRLAELLPKIDARISAVTKERNTIERS
jgi:hypothetical protein